MSTRQIDQARQHSDAEAADVEMLTYLRSYYQLDDSREQEMLGRIWSRLAPAVASSQFQREQENMSDLRDRSDYDLSRISLRANGGQGAQSRPLGRFLGVLAVAVVVALLASVFVVLAKQRDGTTTPPCIQRRHRPGQPQPLPATPRCLCRSRRSRCPSLLHLSPAWPAARM